MAPPHLADALQIRNCVVKVPCSFAALNMALAWRDAQDYDIFVPEASGPMLEAELSHCLKLKGYCVLDGGLQEDVLEEAMEEVLELKRSGRFEPPPAQVVDGILGPEGTREVLWLTPHSEAEYAEGEQLRAACRQLSRVVAATFQFCRDTSMYAGPTRVLAIRGGEVTDDVVDLTEEDCSAWLSTFTQGRLMAIFFLGPGDGTLELQPFDDESGTVEIQTRRNMIIVLRSDLLLHRHVSSSDDYSLACWMTSANSARTRGWNEMDSQIVDLMPAAQELLQWMRERLKVIMDLDVAEKLDGSVPRQWLQMARHSFFRQEKNPVAVRGDAAHLPGRWDPDCFWQTAAVGIDYLTEIPACRWDHTQYYDPAPESWMQSFNFRPPTFTRTNIKHGQYIEGIDLFDSKFFGISVMEAKGMDPMQRHILETSYEALFAAGYKKKDLSNNYIAVYTGTANPEWNYIDREAGACSGTGSSQAITSNRTSFILGMMGPSSSIDCEMSSASVALMVGAAAVATTNARRVESAGNSTAAIIGGVFFGFTPFMWPRFNAWMNPAGRSFTFDQSANGYVRGEMCGSACLKPFAEKVDNEMVASSQPCIGCINGWRMVSNGRAASMTAPHGPAEQECVHDAIRDACIDALDVDAVECHGIGSLLDDSIEVSSLAAVLRGMPGGERETLVLGCVKTHVSAQCEACGMAALIKVLYNIAYANNAPSTHLKQLNPHIELGEAAVIMNNECLAYRGRSAFHGVSSRGIGGTMVHCVVWYCADEKKVKLEKPTMKHQAFNFWPGGGGVLEAGARPAQGYYIVGSWGQWEHMDEMVKNSEGAYTHTVTLGINGFETFQIWLDGDSDRILHPGAPRAPSGSVAYGPSGPQGAEGLKWMIDGQSVTYRSEHQAGPAEAPITTASSVALQKAPPTEAIPFSTRDTGNPGDQYEIQLLVAGKYRAVSWKKVSPLANGTESSHDPSIIGKYYIAGSWNYWTFQEMAVSTADSEVYIATVTQSHSPAAFVIVRNKDWDQVFYPDSERSARDAKVGCQSTAVAGPDEALSGLTWILGGRQGDIFQVEFQRSIAGGKDSRRICWRRQASC